MRDRLRLPATLLMLLTAATAQTFVVDAANGPGTNFIDLPAAVAGVPDGATLLVRAGSYTPFSLVAKGMTILGEPGAEVSGFGFAIPFVAYTAPHQTVHVRGLRFRALLGAFRLFCNYCDGRVLLEDVTTDPNTFTGGSLIAWHCRELWLARCALYTGDQFYSALAAVDSEITAVQSSFGAALNRPAIFAAGGNLTLAECLVEGGGNTNGSALELVGAPVRIGGGTTLSGSIQGYIPFAPAIRGTGGARLDADTVFVNVGQPAFGPGIAVLFEAMPVVQSSTGPLGGTANANVRGPAGALAALLVGLPAPPQIVPGFADAFRLQPNTAAVQVIGTLAGQPLAGAYAVPNATWVRGVAVAWQAALLDPTMGPLASNASVHVHF